MQHLPTQNKSEPNKGLRKRGPLLGSLFYLYFIENIIIYIGMQVYYKKCYRYVNYLNFILKLNLTLTVFFC